LLSKQGVHFSRFSHADIARKAVQQGIVAPISKGDIGRGGMMGIDIVSCRSGAIHPIPFKRRATLRFEPTLPQMLFLLFLKSVSSFFSTFCLVS